MKSTDAARRTGSQHSIKESIYGALFIIVGFLVFYGFYVTGMN